MDAKVSVSLDDARESYNSGQFQTAAEQATEIIRAEPRNYAAWVIRGASLIYLESPYSAILNFTKAISINQGGFDAYNNRGLAYIRLNFWEEAVHDLEQAIALNPKLYMPHFQLGILYSMTEKPIPAEYHFRTATQLCDESDDSYSIIHMFFATFLQGTGHWQEGFKMDQHRYRIKRLQQRFLAPTWQGEDLSHKKLMVFTESGWGDKIQSLRYINLLLETYTDLKIIIATQPDLVSLVKTSFELPIEIRTDVPADYACSLMDVPMIRKLTWDTVPRPQKYLTVDPKLVEKWGQRFKGLPKGVNVGLCWASMNGVSKAIPAWDMMELAGVPQINFISLQVPYVQAPKELKLNDWTKDIRDWSDTGAIIENCDIIISIDTGVAHLAGALGKPVWTIVRFSTYWPWMAADIPPSKDYSIWYPSMTLFRQRRHSDWLDSVRRVTLCLQQQLAGLT